MNESIRYCDGDGCTFEGPCVRVATVESDAGPMGVYLCRGCLSGLAGVAEVEQRAHDKAMEWAAFLAGSFDPFTVEWTEEEQRGGERVLGLFAERLLLEVTPSGPAPLELWSTAVLPGPWVGE